MLWLQIGRGFQSMCIACKTAEPFFIKLQCLGQCGQQALNVKQQHILTTLQKHRSDISMPAGNIDLTCVEIESQRASCVFLWLR